MVVSFKPPPGTLVYGMLLLFSRATMPNSFETPWTVAHQVPLSMGFSRQEDWSG